MPSTSERFESKKKGEKKKECSKNLPLERVKERPRSATNQRAKVMKKI